MIQFKYSKYAVVALSAVMLVAQSALADDAVAKKKFEEGKAFFEKRSSTSMQAIDDALASLSVAEKEAQDEMLKYDILVLESRALYFKGTHVQGREAKKDLHSAGQAKADAAEAITDEFAESAYFAGINLARWGKANGIIASAAQVPQLKRYMAKAMSRVTRDDQNGESVDGYGPLRTLGRMYKELPGILGGSFSESVKYLGKAVKGAPTLALNVVYLADTLMKQGNSADQAEGRRLLNELLAKDPNSLNPARVVETNEEYALARQVLAGRDIE